MENSRFVTIFPLSPSFNALKATSSKREGITRIKEEI